jgi:hypothetical protein
MEGLHESLLQLPEFKGSEYSDKLKIQLKAALDDFNAVYELIQVRYSFIHSFISLFSINPVESTSHGCGNRPNHEI